jgi:putative SOS response-associated peptidase YedK
VPYFIHTNDQPIFAFAGLWDSSRTDTGQRIESVTHITLPANRLLDEIHNTQHRMPAILPHGALWCGAANGGKRLFSSGGRYRD